MRRFLSALATVTLIVPSVAFALTPSELFWKMHMATQPMEFSYEIQGRYHPYYLAGWVSGTSKGAPGLDEDAVAQMRMTLDIASGEGTVRTKMQLRVVDGMLYVFLDKIDAKYEHMLLNVTGAATGKKWFSLPLDELTDTSMLYSLEESGIDMLNEWFTITSQTSASGMTTHTLNLNREVIKEILSALRTLIQQAADAGTLSGKNFPTSTVPEAQFEMTVQTDKAEKILNHRFSLSFGNNLVGLKGKGTFTARGSMQNVIAPIDSVSLEETLEGFGSMSPFMNTFDGVDLDMDALEMEEDMLETLPSSETEEMDEESMDEETTLPPPVLEVTPRSSGFITQDPLCLPSSSALSVYCADQLRASRRR